MKELAMLLGATIIIVAITHWPTLVDANHIDHDEYSKIAKGAVSMLGAMVVVYATWAKYHHKEK